MIDIEQQILETKKCLQDPKYFINTYVYTKDVGDNAKKIKLYPIQEKLVDAIFSKHKVIVLGSRQTGKTTTLNAIVSYLMRMYKNYWVLHISRNVDQGSTDLSEIEFMLDNLPDWMKPTFVVRNAMHKQIDNGSLVKVQPTATEKSSTSKGRGLRSPFLWIDEASFVSLDKLKTSLFPAASRLMLDAKNKGIPYAIVITGTPNGVDGIGKEFYEMWKYAAKSYGIEVNDVFSGVTEINTLKDDVSNFYPIKMHWSDIPVYDEEWYENTKRDFGYYTSVQKQREFHQEYDLLFLGARDSLFPDSLIGQLEIQQPIKKDVVKNEERGYIIGEIEWFSNYDPDRAYLIGVDIATELSGDDSSAIQIVDFETLEQIGQFHKKCKVSDLNTVIDFLIKERVPRSIVIPEKNGIGNQVLEFMEENQYRMDRLFRYLKQNPNNPDKQPKVEYGFTNTSVTRPLVLDAIYQALVENPKRVKSQSIIWEIPNIKKKGNRFEGEQHDDCTFAYGFCVYAVYNHRVDLLEGFMSLPQGIKNFQQYENVAIEQTNDILNLMDDNYKKLVADDDLDGYSNVRRELLKYPFMNFKTL